MGHLAADEQLQERIRVAPAQLIATRIKRARKEFGSHDRLAGEIGTNRGHLIKLEKGTHRPRAETLRRIAEATGRDPEWFVDPEVDPSPFPGESD